MKLTTIIALIVVSAVLTACSSSKYMMGEKEIAEKGYTIKGWSVYKNDSLVGNLRSMEWEIHKNKMYREISIATSFRTDAEMQDIGRFVHSKFPGCKIEINEDDGNSFPHE